jgi:hypothetical protein
MTITVSAEEAARVPLESDREIEALVADLIGVALRRQVWLMFLDELQRPLSVLVPISDLPEVLTRADVEQIALAARDIARLAGAPSVLVTWERDGSARLTADEQTAVDRLGACFAEGPVRLRAQLLSHSEGVRML